MIISLFGKTSDKGIDMEKQYRTKQQSNGYWLVEKSIDNGRTWQYYGKATSEQKAFQFARLLESLGYLECID